MVRALVAALALAAAGCVSVQPAPLSSAEGRAEVNARAAGAVAVVRVVGGRGEEVRALRVGPDSTTWVDRLNGRAASVPTGDVTSVAILRGRTGARVLKGAAIGAAAGGLLGLLVGTTGGDGRISFDPAPAAALGALGGTSYGGLVGLVAGHRDVYRPAPSEAALPRAGRGGPCGGPPLACAAPPRNTAGGAGEGFGP